MPNYIHPLGGNGFPSLQVIYIRLHGRNVFSLRASTCISSIIANCKASVRVILHTCRRNLEYYDHAHQEKLWSCDPDSAHTAGELTIKIPKDVYSTAGLRGMYVRTLLAANFESL